MRHKWLVSWQEILALFSASLHFTTAAILNLHALLPYRHNWFRKLILNPAVDRRYSGNDGLTIPGSPVAINLFVHGNR